MNVVLQLASPRYSPVSQAVSDLAIGRFGWAMDTGFLVYGASVLAFVVGAFAATGPRTRPRAGLILLAVWGLSAMAVAFAHPDLVDAHGYPGTAKAFNASRSTHGKMHLALAAVGFLAMAAGLVASSARLGREPRLRALQPAARLMAAAALAGLLLTDSLGSRGCYGIAERGVSLLGMSWIVMVAWRLRRGHDDTDRPANSIPTAPEAKVMT